MNYTKESIKRECKKVFEIGMNDKDGLSYYNELTESFIRLMVTLDLDFNINTPFVPDEIKDEIAYDAFDIAYECGGVLCVEDIATAIGNYRYKKEVNGWIPKGSKIIDKRTKEYTQLHKIAKCLDTFRNLGVLYQCNEQEYTTVDLKQLKEDLNRGLLI